jgi:iron-sulfur cluster assembly protein
MAGISLGAVLSQDKGMAARPSLGQAEAARPTAPGKVVSLTENAARQALKIMAKDGHDPAAVYLRLGVKGGGCSGMSYLIDVATQKDSYDVEFAYFGVKVLVDKKSLLYLGGTRLDFGTGLQAGWKFENPNSKKGCSCGDSFSI